MQNSKLGLPDYYGNYNYPIYNGKVLVDPTISNLPIEPITLKSLDSQSIKHPKNNYFFHFLIVAILIIALIAGIVYLYRRITFLSSYLDTDYKNVITDIASSKSNDTFNNNFNNKFNLQIKDTTNQIYSNINKNIQSEIIPTINANNSKLFIPSTTDGVRIANFNKKAHVLLSKNTMICENIEDPNSCTCLFDTCDMFNLAHYLLIDRQTGFTDPESTGIAFSGNIVPISVDENNVRITNRFSISFFINITKTVPEDRIIFNWGGDDSLLHYPSLVIRGNSEPDYNGLYRNSLEIKLSNLGKDGVFNVTSDVRGNCLENIPLYVWNHIIITADKTQINIYLNGKLAKTITTIQNVRIGDPDQWIYVGKPLGEPILKNPHGILLAKMRIFPDVIPNDLIINYANEFIKN